MNAPIKLTEKEITEALGFLNGWTIQDGKLHRELKFKDFTRAWGFMTKVALLAERMDHHPEWSNSWNKVMINLTTHEIDGLTNLDVELAREINELL